MSLFPQTISPQTELQLPVDISEEEFFTHLKTVVFPKEQLHNIKAWKHLFLMGSTKSGLLHIFNNHLEDIRKVRDGG